MFIPTLRPSAVRRIPVIDDEEPPPVGEYPSPTDLSDLETVKDAAVTYLAGSPTLINVKTVYGAVGNGSTNDSTAIQSAMNDLHDAGVTVPSISNPWLYFPAGDYRCNSLLTVKSGFNIYMHPDARLRFYNTGDHILWQNCVGMIVVNWRTRDDTGVDEAYRLNNFESVSGALVNHHLIFIDTLNESTSSWHFRFQAYHCLLDGFKSRNGDESLNNIDDGIDIYGAHDIILRNADINVNDDAIALHNVSGRQTYNILIEDCILQSRTSTGIAFGSQVWAGIHDVLFRNNVINDSRVGIYFKAYNPNAPYAECYNVVCHNNVIVDTVGVSHTPLFCDIDNPDNNRVDTFHDIVIDGLTTTCPTSQEGGIWIQNQYNWTLKNLTVNLKRVTNPVHTAVYGEGTSNDSFIRLDGCHHITLEGVNRFQGFQSGASGGWIAGGGVEDYGIHIVNSHDCTIGGSLTVPAGQNPGLNSIVRLDGSGSVNNNFSGLSVTNPDNKTKVSTDGVAQTANQSWQSGWP